MTDRCKQPGKKKNYMYKKLSNLAPRSSLVQSNRDPARETSQGERERADAESTIELECPMEDDGWEEDEFQT